ncbi:22035_t:CDS:2 [Dentiscutata erythropus]|uniref:22035_t:CDS:1 n=1 Tax=Dentiscutata erythropus TaxID=1348616 RepID=A0A9N8VNQ5_9GLOM|nr:22035_t:CDS:2 [Dentiscutata erythropus]
MYVNENVLMRVPDYRLSKTEDTNQDIYSGMGSKVEITEKKVHDSYAILSYVWGDPKEEGNKLSPEQKEELNNTTNGLGYANGDKDLTLLGYKS